MKTYFDLLLRLARKVTAVRMGIATGGSTTSLEDDDLQGLGDWENGVVWILSGTYSGEIRSIYQHAKDKLTWSSALAGDIVSGVSYAVASNEVALDLLKGAVQSALDYFWTMAEDTSLVQDSDEAVYTIPSAVLQADGYGGLYAVRVARNATDPYNWMKPHRHWEEMGTELRFAYKARPLYDGYPLRLVYMKRPVLSAFDDEVPLDVNYDALYWRALIELGASLKNLRPNDSDGHLANLFQEAQVEWQRRVPPKPRRADNLALY